MQDSFPIIEVSSEPIELYKVLKIANMVSGGGEAKIVICEGYVYLNGEVEFQKRKKIYQDDIVEFNGEAIQVNVNKQAIEQQVNTASNPLEVSPTKNKNPRKKAKSHKKKLSDKAEKNNTEAFSAGKRKPISF